MHGNLALLKNGTRTLRGIVRELLPDGDCRDAILDLILLAYRSARDEVSGMEEAVERYGYGPAGHPCAGSTSGLTGTPPSRTRRP